MHFLIGFGYGYGSHFLIGQLSSSLKALVVIEAPFETVYEDSLP